MTNFNQSKNYVVAELLNVYGYNIFIDKKNRIWVGTNGAGLLLFDEKTGSYKICDNPLVDIPSDNFVRDIETYKDSLMLIAGSGGLYVFNPRTFEYKDYSIGTKYLSSITLDKKNNYWITSLFNGVFRIDSDGNIKHFVKNDCDKYSIPDNSFVNGMCDRAGNVWLGSFFSGVIMMNGNRKPFSHLYYLAYKPSIPSSSVFALAEDDKKRVWIGTHKGLTVWDRQNDTFKPVEVEMFGEKGKDASIVSLLLSGHNIWIGTPYGVVRYNIATGRQHHFVNKDNDPQSLSFNSIHDITKDSKGNIWVGTSKGLSRYDKSINGFHNYFAGEGPNSLSNSNIWRIYEDSSKRLWICTFEGLNLYDPVNDNFKVFKFDNAGLGVQSIDLSDIMEIGKDIFCLGSAQGLFIFDYKTKKVIKTIGVEDGLSSGYIYRMLQTDKDIWVSTNRGLAVIDKKTYKVKAVYEEHDGLQGDEFNLTAIKLSDGYFLFGGVNGVTGFYPDKIKRSDFVPPVYFTGLSINGRDVYMRDTTNDKHNITFKKDIIAANRVDFDPDEHVFTFRFSALDYSDPEQIKYFYRLLPGSDEWVSLGKRNYVTFVNLNPGNYTLQVKSTNSDDILCNNTKSIKVSILPPLWRQKWVIGLEIVLFLMLLILIFKYRSYKYKKDRQKLEKIVSDRTQEIQVQKEKLEQLASSLEDKVRDRTAELEEAKQKAEESDMLKSAFLSNMSHEIRTPMNAIMGFSELLVTPGFEEEERKSFANMVKANGDTLLTLLNDIIDISMIESGQLKLNYSDVNPAELIESVYGNFINSLLLAEKKEQVKLRAVIDEAHKDVTVQSDFYRLMQIMNNLVGNAIKFTSKGYVEFGYIVKDRFVEFYVTDTGIGIGEEEVKSIFKRFYKMQNGKTNFYPGNGLGLTITKNLVEALKGKITVESRVGKGTTFRFTIPL